MFQNRDLTRQDGGRPNPWLPLTVATVFTFTGLLACNRIAPIPSPTPTPDAELACIDSGGTVETALCCLSTEDFPDMCVTGACGCAPGSSHEVRVCGCGAGMCFDGTECVPETMP